VKGHGRNRLLLHILVEEKLREIKDELIKVADDLR